MASKYIISHRAIPVRHITSTYVEWRNAKQVIDARGSIEKSITNEFLGSLQSGDSILGEFSGVSLVKLVNYLQDKKLDIQLFIMDMPPDSGSWVSAAQAAKYLEIYKLSEMKKMKLESVEVQTLTEWRGTPEQQRDSQMSAMTQNADPRTGVVYADNDPHPELDNQGRPVAGGMVKDGDTAVEVNPSGQPVGVASVAGGQVLGNVSPGGEGSGLAQRSESAAPQAHPAPQTVQSSQTSPSGSASAPAPKPASSSSPKVEVEDVREATTKP